MATRLRLAALLIVLIPGSANRASAEWFLSVAAGRSDGVTVEDPSLSYWLSGGYWLTKWLGCEVIAGGVPHAFQRSDSSNGARLSSISHESINVLAAPIATKRWKVYGSFGIGPTKLIADIPGAALRASGAGVDRAVGVLGRVAEGLEVRLEFRGVDDREASRPTSLGMFGRTKLRTIAFGIVVSGKR